MNVIIPTEQSSPFPRSQDSEFPKSLTHTIHWLICSKHKITKNWQIHLEKWGPVFSHSRPLQSLQSHNNTSGGSHHWKLSRQHSQKLKFKKRSGFRQGQCRCLLRGRLRNQSRSSLLSLPSFQSWPNQCGHHSHELGKLAKKPGDSTLNFLSL